MRPYYMNTPDRYSSRESRVMHRGEIYYCYKRPEDVEVGAEIKMKTGRPCVLVSKEDLCNNSPLVTVVYLSSSPKTDYPTHVVISNKVISSTAICEQPISVSKARLGDLVGTVDELELRSIDRALAEAHGLDYLISTLGSDSSNKLYEELLVTKTERDTYKRMVDTFIKSSSK